MRHLARRIGAVLAFAVLPILPALPAWAVDCRDVEFDGAGFSVCEVDATREDIRLFLDDETGRPYGQFPAVARALEADGQILVFAMNAGMYHEDRSPVGLYVQGDVTRGQLVTRAGPGNFGLLPNGVFCVRDGRADVIETLRFQADAPDCRSASQSGPMLVIDGALHPRFLPDSTSRFIRNGVGTSADGTRAVFAISQRPVTFDHFGRLFRDALALPNALYFDGNVSRIYAPELGREDVGFRLGPIVGVAAPR
ncbi:MAG: phosphodiester glycosidase family protein [Marinibacterium sp.]|nr:phosphodiester glycosidase family protein [Marinibacterium sp.]